MSNYQLTPEQLQVMQETNIQLISNIVHISVMIDEDLDLNLIERYDLKKYLKLNKD